MQIDALAPTPMPKHKDVINLEVASAALRTAVLKVAKHNEGSSTIPILKCVTLTKAAKEPLVVAHKGIDMHLEFAVAADGEGAVTLPIRPLAAFLAAVDGERVTITKTKDDARVRLACGSYTAGINALPVSDTPEFKVLNSNLPTFRKVPLGEGVLNWLFALTLPFVSNEETRYYLNGVCLEFGQDAPNTLRAVATDGHRLGTRRAVIPAVFEGRPPVIVPRLAVAAVQALSAAREVTLFVEDLHAVFAIGEDTVVRARLIDGTFPDWRRVVPRDEAQKHTIEIDTSAFTRLARMRGGFGDRSGAAVKVHRHEDGRVHVSAEVPDSGSLDGAFEGKHTTFEAFGVNVSYMASIAKAFGSKRLTLATQDPSSPMTLRAPESPEGELAVVMPMRV